jgi:hypothetical protein
VPVIPAIQRSINRRIEVQASLGIKQFSISKIISVKKAGSVAQTQGSEFNPNIEKKDYF